MKVVDVRVCGEHFKGTLIRTKYNGKLCVVEVPRHEWPWLTVPKQGQNIVTVAKKYVTLAED